MFKDVDTKQYDTFEISDRKNELKELLKYLKQDGLRLVGFNNLNFDYPILHEIITNRREWNALSIYRVTESVLRKKYSSISPWKVQIPQLDLYRIWHYDNKNKRTSLKWLEFALRLPNVEDLPYAVGSVLRDFEKDNVIKYCKNDIDATEAFYEISEKHIDIRKVYSKHENLDLINASEIKMSKEIFAKHLSNALKVEKRDIKSMSTPRKMVNISDTIFDYIKFNDPTNKETLNKFNSLKWYNTEGMSDDEKDKYKIGFTVPYKNIIREYAIGGLHGFGKPGIYESNEEYILVDVDFASFYPHICFRNNLHPKHIPEGIFNELYEGFYIERKKYSKKDPRNYVLKIVLNGSYGLSKDKYSFLYDPKWQLEICINGQLILTLLSEKILDRIPDAQIVFENTDGAMYRVKRTHYESLLEACKEVEDIVDIPLETQVCKKIIARDVNNYINIIDDTNIKFKGVFEIDRDYHKNHSKRIVALALANYFVNGKNVEDYIKNYLDKNCTDVVKEKDYDTEELKYYEHYGIYDFCCGFKSIGGNKLYKREIVDFSTVDTELGKMNRYYISNNGYDLVKKLPPLEKNKMTSTEKHKAKVDSTQFNIFDFIEDIKVEAKDREENLEAGWKCTVFNKFEEKDSSEYDINYEYYISECGKVITAITNE